MPILIRYIQSALKRMSDMQNSLLTLSRLISAQHRFDNIDTNGMVSNIIDNMDFNEYETHPDILCDNLLPVHGVNTMVEILFSEIIDNACRYGSSSGVQKVSIKCYDRDAEIVFEVQDNGIGIDTAFTEVIFNMFRRLHGQDDYGGRIGAGLTISKRIIAHHKGHIWIKSKLDEGTSVLFSLPKKSTIA